MTPQSQRHFCSPVRKLPGLLKLTNRETMQLRRTLGCFRGAEEPSPGYAAPLGEGGAPGCLQGFKAMREKEGGKEGVMVQGALAKKGVSSSLQNLRVKAEDTQGRT